MTTAVIIILFAAALIAVMAFAIRHEYAKRRIRASFGPEYARVKDEHSGTRAVDRELARRIQLYSRLHLEPISADDRDSYATSWERIRGGFLDDPTVALSGAEQLIARLTAARGYPVQEQREQLALLSVQHGRVLANYRQALWVSERLRADPASMPTEVKRAALTQYRTFFEDLLTVPGAVAPRMTKESEVTP